MARTKSNYYYAIYRGDEFLAHGFCEDLALRFDVEEKTIREMAHISYHHRVAQAPNPDKRLIAIKVDELTKEDFNIQHRKRRRKNDCRPKK